MSSDSDESLRSAQSGETVIPLLAEEVAVSKQVVETGRVLRAAADQPSIQAKPSPCRFIDKFRSAGLGSQAVSWLGRTDGGSLAAAQVENALGGIAGRLGLGGSVPRLFGTRSARSSIRSYSWDSGLFPAAAEIGKPPFDMNSRTGGRLWSSTLQRF